MWMIRLSVEGCRQRSVVTEPALHPMKNTKSDASTNARVSDTPPLEPTTPTQRGSISARLPCPDTVVATGISSLWASWCSSSSPPDRTTPPPQMMIGFEADSNASAMAETSPASGSIRSAGKELYRCSPPTSCGETVPFCVSNGSPRCAEPGLPDVICLNVSRNCSGRSPAASSMSLCLLKGRNRAFWSSSVRGNLPRDVVATSVVMANIGTEESFASTTPGRI